MVELIVSGIGLGIVLSFLTGPVFFALIKTSIEKGFQAGVSLAGGVLLSDIIYVAVSIYGSSFIALENHYHKEIGLVGSIILMVIGIYYLTKKVKLNYQCTPSRKHNMSYFFKGFFMCIFNPSLLLYWISVTSGLISLVGKLSSQHILAFFGSILLTQFSMDVMKAYYANKLRYRIKEKTLLRLNQVAGVLILIFSLRLIFTLIE